MTCFPQPTYQPPSQQPRYSCCPECGPFHCHALFTSLHSTFPVIFTRLRRSTQRTSQGLHILRYCPLASIIKVRSTTAFPPTPPRDFQPRLLEALYSRSALCRPKFTPVCGYQQPSCRDLSSDVPDEDPHHCRFLCSAIASPHKLDKMGLSFLPCHGRCYRSNSNQHRASFTPQS